jgi:hypothetical protein
MLDCAPFAFQQLCIPITTTKGHVQFIGFSHMLPKRARFLAIPYNRVLGDAQE